MYVSSQNFNESPDSSIPTDISLLMSLQHAEESELIGMDVSNDERSVHIEWRVSRRVWILDGDPTCLLYT